jgi:hypothetical protein
MVSLVLSLLGRQPKIKRKINSMIQKIVGNWNAISLVASWVCTAYVGIQLFRVDSIPTKTKIATQATTDSLKEPSLVFSEGGYYSAVFAISSRDCMKKKRMR